MIEMTKNGRFRHCGVFSNLAAWWKLSDHDQLDSSWSTRAFASQFWKVQSLWRFCKSSWWKLPNHFCILNSNAFASFCLRAYFTEWKTTKQFVLVLLGRSRVVYDPYGMMYTLLPGHIKLLVGVNKSVSNNVSIDRSFQRYLVLDILTNPDRAILTKKQHFGENPLPISLFTILLIEYWICTFPKKLARQKSMKWKTIKWATKPPIKKEKKGKKEFRQGSRKICLSLQNSVLAILMLISGKLVQNLEQKRGISEECGFLARLLSPKSELSSLCFKVGLK